MIKSKTSHHHGFDAIKGGYIPPEKLNISPKLKLHRKASSKIDPITYEVVRHSLWNINEEHGATIQRLSGSPVMKSMVQPFSDCLDLQLLCTPWI